MDRARVVSVSPVRGLAHGVFAGALGLAGVRRSPTMAGQPLVDKFSLGGVGPRTAAFLAAEVAARRPARVLECGPGASTIAMARAMAITDNPGRIVALEHSPCWARLLRRRLMAQGLSSRVRLLLGPLEARGDAPWYARAEDAAAMGPYDMVFIDGPPATDGEPRRAPALETLWDAIAPGALIVLDDGRRAGERECVRRWMERFGGSLRATMLPLEKGLWALVKRPASV